MDERGFPFNIRLAQAEDAPVLTEISKHAFHSDIHCGSTETGGPPGYDDVKWQADIIAHRRSACYKLLLGEQIIGGAIVHPLRGQGEYCLGRIYIAPEYHRQGLGRRAMQLIEDAHPDARKWVLDTPAWNARTRQFYLQLGYELIAEDEYLVFEKITGASDSGRRHGTAEGRAHPPADSR